MEFNDHLHPRFIVYELCIRYLELVMILSIPIKYAHHVRLLYYPLTSIRHSAECHLRIRIRIPSIKHLPINATAR